MLIKKIVIFLICYFFLFHSLKADELQKNLERIVARYLSIADYKNAEEACFVFISQYPKKCFAYSLLGKIYESSGDLLKAIQIYKRGLKNNPDCYKLYFRLAKNYFSLGRYKISLKYLVELKKHGPQSIKKAEVSLFEFNKFTGKIFFILKDYYSAINYFEESLRYRWDDLEVYSFLQNSYKNTGDKNLADAYFDIANLIRVKKIKDKNGYRLYSGIIFIKYRKYKKALGTLLTLYEKMQNHIVLNFNIGLCYLLLDNPYNALEYMEKTVKLYKKKTQIKYFLKRLFRIESQGAKYHLLLALTYFLNREFEKARKTYLKIRNYDTYIYRNYSYNDFTSKESKIYKEMPFMYEFP